MNEAKRWACLGVCLFALVALTGCWVPSVNALYEDSDIVYEHGLEGSWMADDGNASLTFARDSSGKCYDLTYEEKGEKSKFEGCVAQLGKNMFLDITPAELPQPEALRAHLFPLHSFWKLETGIDHFSLQPLNDDWFKEMAAKKRLRLAYVRSGSDIVLTASTASLRSFITRYGNSDALFGEKSDYHRQK